MCWCQTGPSPIDLKVIHQLNTDLILEASLASGNSAEVGEIGSDVLKIGLDMHSISSGGFWWLGM